MKSLDQLPPFSPVMNRLMASMANEDVPFAHLAAMIERDTVLSGNVLRLVNSALYGRRGTVSSVRAAVSILGLNKLRNFLLGLSVSQVLANVRTPQAWGIDRFNLHSAAVAVLTDLIVQRRKVDYPEGGFAAGLLHDLGKMMIATALPDEFAEVQRLTQETGRPGEEIEQERLDLTHSELSAAALARWGLPMQIQKAVLYHHRSDSDPAAQGQSDGTLPLSAALEAANEIACALGHGLSPENEAGAAKKPDEWLRKMQLQDQQERFLMEFEVELAAMRGMG